MVRIITDSVASIAPELAKERDIEVVSLYLHFDGEEHVESELDIDEFYKTIDSRLNDIPKSSQPSQHTLEKLFEAAAEAGDEVLGIFISSKLSGTLDGAIRAARAVKAHHLDFQFAFIDSASTGSEEGFCVLDAADARDAGGTLADCAAAAENAVLCSRFAFSPETLAYLRAGGRIGAASALIGSAIRITPILTVVDGSVETLAKVRTHKKAVSAILDKFKVDVEEHGLKRVVVHYIGKKTEQLKKLRESVEDIAGHSVEVCPVSPVVGVHVGPALGIAYECKEYIEGKINNMRNDLVFTV